MTDIAITNDWSNEERREYERYSVNFYLRVIDLDSDTLLGDVVDISLAGMRLVSEVPHPVDKTCHAKMEIASLCPDEIQAEHIPSATDELDAIVAHTEEATVTILDAAEKLEELAASSDKKTAEAITEKVTT